MRVSISLLRFTTMLIGVVAIVAFTFPLINLFQDLVSGRFQASIQSMSINIVNDTAFFSTEILVSNNGSSEIQDVKLLLSTQYFTSEGQLDRLPPKTNKTLALETSIPLEKIVKIIEEGKINVSLLYSFTYKGLYAFSFNITSKKPLNFTLMEQVGVYLVSFEPVGPGNTTHFQVRFRVQGVNPSFISLENVVLKVELLSEGVHPRVEELNITIPSASVFQKDFCDVFSLEELRRMQGGFDYRVYIVVGGRDILAWEGSSSG